MGVKLRKNQKLVHLDTYFSWLYTFLYFSKVLARGICTSRFCSRGGLSSVMMHAGDCLKISLQKNVHRANVFSDGLAGLFREVFKKGIFIRRKI